MSAANVVAITIGPVDRDLLRKQRDWLLATFPHESSGEADGLVNLLDHMLDVADGEVPLDRGWGST